MRSIVSVLLILFLPAISYTQGRVATQFDKFKNLTRISLESYSIERTNFQILIQDMQVAGGFSCPRTSSQCEPRTVELLFIARTDDWQLNDARHGRLLIDRRSIDIGRGNWDGQVLSGDDLREYIDFNVSPAVIRSIAHAKHVEIQLGLFDRPEMMFGID